MASVAVTNTFVAATSAIAGEVNQNFSDLVNYINARNAGSGTWDVMNATASTILGGNFYVGSVASTGLRLRDDGTDSSLIPGSGRGSGLFVLYGSGGSVAMTIGQNTGVQLGAPTGGDKGAGTINTASDHWVNGQVRIRDDGTDSFLYGGVTRGTGTIKLVATGGSTAVTIGQNTGVQLGAPTGGDKGAGTINTASDHWVNGQVRIRDDGTDSFLYGGVTRGTGLLKVVASGGSVAIQIAQGTGVHFPSSLSGIQVGSAPTGGDKGAGTINVSGDLYKNDTAYTNPDYVFEWWATGKIERFKDNPGALGYAGVLPLDDLEVYVKEHMDLPRVKTMHVHGEGQGVFARADIALEKIEELAIYILELHKRLKKLEG